VTSQELASSDGVGKDQMVSQVGPVVQMGKLGQWPDESDGQGVVKVKREPEKPEKSNKPEESR